MFRPELQTIANAFAREAGQCWETALTLDELGDVSSADAVSHRATRLAMAAGYLRSRAGRAEKRQD
jgi:hypothetical protein